MAEKHYVPTWFEIFSPVIPAFIIVTLAFGFGVQETFAIRPGLVIAKILPYKGWLLALCYLSLGHKVFFGWIKTLEIRESILVILGCIIKCAFLWITFIFLLEGIYGFIAIVYLHTGGLLFPSYIAARRRGKNFNEFLKEEKKFWIDDTIWQVKLLCELPYLLVLDILDLIKGKNDGNKKE
jgi:hypothetical protein